MIEHNLRMDIGMEQRAEQTLVLNWQISPFLMTNGLEIVNNVWNENPERDLQDDYKEMRDKLMKDGFIVIAAMGRGNSGKGSFLMGLTRLFRRDKYLRDLLGEDGSELEILSFPFAHCARVAMLPEVGIVPEGVEFADFDVATTRRISEFQWSLIEQHGLIPGAKNKQDIVEGLKSKKKKRVVVFESSTPLAYPVGDQTPVEVKGMDDNGNSTFYNAALDRRLESNAYLYLINRDRVFENESLIRFRQGVSAQDDSIFAQDMDILVTLKDGSEIKAKDLPQKDREMLLKVLAISMAPPAALKRFDLSLEKVEEDLTQKGLIAVPRDNEYFQFLKEGTKGGIIIVQNPYLEGPKTYDSEYLVRSVPAILYPQILQS